MIVDNRGDASHEGKTCRHVEVKMERLAEPAKQTTDTRGELSQQTQDNIVWTSQLDVWNHRMDVCQFCLC